MTLLRSFGLLVALGIVLAPPASVPALAYSDRLEPGQSLYPGQAIVSGSTTLTYQGDNNLVLYQGGVALWATMTFGGTDRFTMQPDCNAVVYGSEGPVWASGTDGRGSSCEARVSEGDWFVCSGTTRVWSALGGGDCGGGGGGVPPGYVGCFTDDPSRALPAWQGEGFGIQDCIDRCRSLNYVYSGSQWYNECFCGNSLGYAQVGDAECNTPCHVGGGYCGGGWRNSIYATGASGMVDADLDGIDDGTELQIARDLMPAILPHTQEHCAQPVDPKPIAFRLRHPGCTSGARLTDWVAINYYVLYSQDCGCGGHAGDNEGFVVLGRFLDGRWQRVFVSTVAHTDTSAEKHSTCEGCGAIVASQDKHGNYTRVEACHEWWICDEHCNWLPPTPYFSASNTRLWNVGEPARHLITDWSTVHPQFWGGPWTTKFMNAGICYWTLYKFWMPPPPPGCAWSVYE